MPSIDARNSDQAFVLDGKNFVFDSKGPRSGFTTKRLTPFPLGAPNDVQAKRLEGRTFVFTADSILIWRTIGPITWDSIYAFNTPIPNSERTPWQAIYMNGFYYLAQQNRGFFQAETLMNTQKLWLHPKTDANIPGLIPKILGMEVVHGRAVMVNSTTIQWSALANLSDLSPTLGGAGFQAISNFVKGTFLSITSFQDGFVCWTTEGAILAEYIGGDEVWRFSAYESEERPYSIWSTVNMINGGSIMLSRRGLKVTNAQNAPQDWTADFNEFLRGYLDDRAENLRKWRLEYDQSTETVYLSESTDLNTYWRTFVLCPTLNKWGIFSDKVCGFLPLTEEVYGYVDESGYCNYFDTKTLNRETQPDNALGLVPIHPRVEKQHNYVSSTAVGRAIVPETAIPMSIFEVTQDGWYDPKAIDTVQQNGLAGMDSWIEIGYLRPSETGPSAPYGMELQQLVIGSLPSAPPAVVDSTTRWNQDVFYPTIEDMNSDATFVDGNFADDWNIDGDSIDYLYTDSEGNLDLGGLNYPTVTFADDGTEDLMNENLPDEDLMGNYYGLPEITYQLEVHSSEDGITFDVRVPEIQRFNIGKRDWGVISPGVFQRVKVSAIEAWEYYHIQFLEATMTGAGGSE